MNIYSAVPISPRFSRVLKRLILTTAVLCAGHAWSQGAGAASTVSETVAPVAPAASAVQVIGNVQRGAMLYQSKCTGCHSVEESRFGPAHRGVVGRRAGSLAGYKYSVALANIGTIWTPEALDRWLQDPAKFAPGQRMSIKVVDPTERADLIAYLATFK